MKNNLTREDILNAYQFDANKIIRTPGRFEGEPIYAPYFWDCALQGMYAEDVNGVFFVPLDESDHAMFPELYLNTWDGQTDPTNKPAYGIALEESDQGFVYTKVYDTQAEYNAAIEEMERQESGRDRLPIEQENMSTEANPDPYQIEHTVLGRKMLGQ